MVNSKMRPRGLRLIIGYKLVKAPVMFGLALWLTLGREGAASFLEDLTRHLAEGGWVLQRVGQWLGLHLTAGTLRGGAVLAWLDTATTALEATLLLLGKSWGEWLVVAGVGVLLPVEIYWLFHHPTWVRGAVLAINAGVFGYLLRRRILDWRGEPLAGPVVKP